MEDEEDEDDENARMMRDAPTISRDFHQNCRHILVYTMTTTTMMMMMHVGSVLQHSACTCTVANQ